MNRQTKRKLYNRSRLARQFLLSQMRLAKYYETDKQAGITPEELEYRKQVINATAKARRYMQNFDDADAHLKFMDMVLRGDMNKLAILDAAHISTGTYNNWMYAMLRAFGKGMGIWI